MQSLDLDLDLVRCFLVVAESGGFTSASRRLNLSQSAVSLKIQRLEALMDRRVFDRTSRSLKLTVEGEVVLGYARRLLALNQEMIHSVANPALEGVLRLGVVQHFGQSFLPGLLSQFKRAHPKVRLNVEIGMTVDLLSALEEDQLDLVMAASGYAPDEKSKAGTFSERRVLMRESLVWVQSDSSVIDPKDNPVPLVLLPPRSGFRRITLDVLERAGRSWQIAYSSASLASLQAAVQADLGIAVFSKSSVLPGMRVIKTRLGLPPLPQTAIAVYTTNSPTKPLVAKLIDLVSMAVEQCRNGKQPSASTGKSSLSDV